MKTTYTKFYDGVILNVSGVGTTTTHEQFCTQMKRGHAELVRQLHDVPREDITYDDAMERLQKVVDYIKGRNDVTAAWIRPIKSAPFMFGMLEDMLLSEGIAVAYPDERFVEHKNGKPVYEQMGWWVNNPYDN